MCRCSLSICIYLCSNTHVLVINWNLLFIFLDQDRENISELIHTMKQEGVLASDLYMDGLWIVLEGMGELEQEIPLVKSNVAMFAAQVTFLNI